MELSRSKQAEIFRQNLGAMDCGVVAVMSVAQVGYAEAEEAAMVASRGRYQPGMTGMQREDQRAAIEKLTGGRMVEVEVPYNATPASVADELPPGRYTVHIAGHVMPLIDGDLFNARSFWAVPVEAIYRLEMP